MSVEFDRGSPRKFDSRTLNRKTLYIGGLGVCGFPWYANFPDNLVV